MREEKKQFVNNECLNNIPLIINSNTIPSKNNATLVPNRILMLMRKTIIVVILTIRIIIILNYFYVKIH
jgi:hypothetical protein